MFITMNRFFVVLLFFSLPSLTFSQVNDAGMWYSLGLEKKLSQKFSAEFGAELRMNENFAEAGTYYTEAGIGYRVNKVVSVSAGYRFIQKRRVEDTYSTRHRFLINLNMRHKIEMFSFAGRVRYQSQYSDVNSSEVGKIPDNYIRTKLTAKVDLEKRYTPYFSYEAFFHVNRPEGALYDNYRIAVGIEYEFSKKSAIDLGYMIDREINVSDPWTNYVFSLGWNYKL
jgi:hypothetical protein